MLAHLLILLLAFVAIQADGEFSILSYPKSLTFKGNEPLPSDYVSDVLSVSQGYPVSSDAQWSGLIINDPFDLAKSCVVTIVDGVNSLSVNQDAKTYKLAGSTVHESLDVLTAELESLNKPVCDINFNQFDEAITNFRFCFGEVVLPELKTPEYLTPALHSADNDFYQTIKYIKAASENLAAIEKANNVLILRLSLAPIARAHGDNSAALAEAKKMTSSVISQLNNAAEKSSSFKALVVSITNDQALEERVKRQAGAVAGTNTTKPSLNDEKNKYNLAEEYSEDYPVIFNIILWFMVTFVLSLVAICYAVATMDPGRDSIIYRMTSTRMKKDN